MTMNWPIQDNQLGDGSADEAATDAFYEDLPKFGSFSSVTNVRCYKPIPSDWVVGLADVVTSAQAVADGRYKAVNIVGAAVIAAVSNALPALSFPFAFGGDGASFAVPGRHADAVRELLADTASWSEDTHDLRLRIAVVPVREIRKAGYDVRVARYSVGGGVSYAMFSGGGLGWTEEQLKQGVFRLDRARPGAVPDLTGLVCSFATIGSTNGVILTVIVVPQKENPEFAGLVDDIVALTETEGAHGPRPSAISDPAFAASTLSVAAVNLDQAAKAEGTIATKEDDGPVPSFSRRPDGNASEGGSDSHGTIQDTDFRKFEDGLRMTIDCLPAIADAIEAMLVAAQATGICRFGTHRQRDANLTCVLPSNRNQHAHFVDGAGGGYSVAAAMLKSAIVR